MYNTINSFGSKQPDKTHFCCDILLKCEGYVITRMFFFESSPNFIQCDSINNSKSCIAFGASNLPSGLCGRILGNANPIIATEGTCPSPDTIINTH